MTEKTKAAVEVVGVKLVKEADEFGFDIIRQDVGEYASEIPDGRSVEGGDVFDRHGGSDPRTFRYFVCRNTVAGHVRSGVSEAEARKYCRQDYQEAEDFNNGEWCYYFCYLEATLSVLGKTQTVRTSGVGGVASNSGAAEFDSIAEDERFELKEQLSALGVNLPDDTKIEGIDD